MIQKEKEENKLKQMQKEKKSVIGSAEPLFIFIKLIIFLNIF